MEVSSVICKYDTWLSSCCPVENDFQKLKNDFHRLKIDFHRWIKSLSTDYTDLHRLFKLIIFNVYEYIDFKL